MTNVLNLSSAPIEFPNNFIIQYDPNLDTSSKRIKINLSPKVGTWTKAFIGIPQNEDSVVSYYVRPTNSIVYGSEHREVTLNGVLYHIQIISFITTTPVSPISMYCNNEPSMMIFGDLDAPYNQFIIKFPFQNIKN
ncbi:hypothetical protein [Ferruginibacter sp. HRS2-29]|uniref:hypothetical protein n=1 Tax=Ferruginibacter sp. HRS2-29 TaxID=2487334 RepID=UPI0020CD5914|nr:hypothetical protein [Ferruginibacter sp. HRS2-29]MCP9749950.1 hypothetical protein [Ferruginibacter sp. HRS2-29]